VLRKPRCCVLLSPFVVYSECTSKDPDYDRKYSSLFLWTVEIKHLVTSIDGGEDQVSIHLNLKILGLV
jgi:hypothetical protein